MIQNFTFVNIGSDDQNEDNDDETIDQGDLLEAVLGVADAAPGGGAGVLLLPRDQAEQHRLRAQAESGV